MCDSGCGGLPRGLKLRSSGRGLLNEALDNEVGAFFQGQEATERYVSNLHRIHNSEYA